ncbi:MAG: YmfQ family protein [Gammaproteobacteria bacterium]
MGLSADTYAATERALLPPGRALADGGEGTLTDLLEALAQEFSRVDASGDVLLQEAFPDTAVELLPDWERIAKLPSACTPAGQTTAQRQASVVRKLTANEAQTIAFIVALAASYGYTISIVERRALRFGYNAYCGYPFGSWDWQFVWEAHSEGTPIEMLYFDTGHCGDDFGAFGDPTMECRLKTGNQSHIIPRFCYDFTGYNLFQYRDIGRLFWIGRAGSLFQDTAGTVPVTAYGQTVGLIKDLSGHGGDLMLTVGPGAVYSQDENGYDCLVSAGDSMYSGSDADLPMGANNVHIAATVAFDQFTKNASCFNYGTSAILEERGIGLDNSTPQKMTANIYNVQADGQSPIAGQPYVMECDVLYHTVSLYIDGVFESSATGVVNTVSGALTLFGSALPGKLFTGKFYGGVIFGGSSWPRAAVTRWLGALAGQTFPGYDLLLLDQAFARSSQATWTDPAGILQTASANAARYNNDRDTGEAYGLLIEEPRTNQITDPFNPTTSNWVQTNAAAALAQGTGPDGSNSLIKLTTDVVATVEPHMYNITCLIPDPAPDVISVLTWVQRGNYDNGASPTIRMHSKQTPAPGAGTPVDVSARILQGPGSVDIADFDAGLVQVYGLSQTEPTLIETRTMIPLIAGQTYILTCRNRDQAIGAQVGDTTFWYAQQFEFADFASTLIPSGVATRPGDDVAIPPTWAATEAGCLWGEFRVRNLPPNPYPTSSGIVAALAYTAANTFIGVNVDSNGQLIITGRLAGSAYQQAYTPNGSIVAGQSYKFAASWSPTAFRLSLNGAAVISAAQTQALPTAPSQFFVGSISGTYYLNGTVRSLRYAPFAPANAQLQALAS